jgi:predicted transcriptional regulator
MKIPNKLLELSRNELMVACRLYSIVNRHTKQTTNGYAVCIKQETIAASCGLSVATVKRVLKALSEKGIITHQYRQTRANGCLGATHYDLQAFSFLSDYFYMPNDVFKLGLSQKMFYAYALFCKLADSNKRSFFHSYNDLAEMMQLKRSEVIELVGALIKTRLVFRTRRRTKAGDHTDNLYFIVLRVKGRIKKKWAKEMRAPRTRLSNQNVIKKTISNPPANPPEDLANIISQKNNFVKAYGKKCCNYFYDEGGG